MSTDLIYETLKRIENTVRDTNRPPKELHMHPEDLRRLRRETEAFMAPPLEKTADNGVFRFSGVDLVEDELAPRLPRRQVNAGDHMNPLRKVAVAPGVFYQPQPRETWTTAAGIDGIIVAHPERPPKWVRVEHGIVMESTIEPSWD